MTLVNVDTGEIVEPLTHDEALALTESIRGSVADLEDQVVRAFFGRVWLAMEYESWDEYIAGEFKSAPLALPREERRTQVASLRQQGLSLPAIASVTGASVGTVHSDLQAFSSERVPDRITGADGKDYPATQTERELGQNEAAVSVAETCPTCGQILPVNQRKEG